MARRQAFVPGTILILDRGYLDFTWFARLTTAACFSVTGMKDGTAYDVVKRHPVRDRGDVVADEWIALRTPQTRTKYEPDTRCAEWKSSAEGRPVGVLAESSRPRRPARTTQDHGRHRQHRRKVGRR